MSQILDPLLDISVAPPSRVPDFYFDRKTKVIYFLKSIENRKVKFTTKIRASGDPASAAAEIARAKRFANTKLRDKLNSKKARVRTLIKDELELWLKVKEGEGHKYDTLNNIKRAKLQIEEYWGDRFPHEINRDNLTSWYAWWSENKADLQMENAVKYLRNFCRYLAEKTVDDLPLLPAVPTIKDPGFREARARRQKKKENIFTAADFRKIYATAPGMPEEVLVLFMYLMATRIDETLNLRFGEEILLDRDVPVYRWRIGQNKADLWGEQALHPELIDPLLYLLAARTAAGTNRLFPQQRDISKAMREQMIDWDSWRTRAAIGWHWTPHTFRHTCLSNLFGNPKLPQALICKQYRVSLQTAMEHYIKTTHEGMLLLRDALKVEL